MISWSEVEAFYVKEVDHPRFMIHEHLRFGTMWYILYQPLELHGFVVVCTCPDTAYAKEDSLAAHCIGAAKYMRRLSLLPAANPDIPVHITFHQYDFHGHWPGLVGNLRCTHPASCAPCQVGGECIVSAHCLINVCFVIVGCCV